MNKKTILWSVGGVLTVVLGYLVYKKITSTNLFGSGIEIIDPSSSDGSNGGDLILVDDLSTKGNGNFPLKMGSRGNEVKRLQAWLNEMNGENLVTDGIFGRLTESAVKRNQDPISNFRKSYPKAVYGQVGSDFYINV